MGRKTALASGPLRSHDERARSAGRTTSSEVPILRFDVYGREVGISRDGGRWRAVFLGREGKHRAAPEIAIPPDLPERDLQRFLADLFHEAARPDRPDVARLPDASDGPPASPGTGGS